jgi:hypothetical protein
MKLGLLALSGVRCRNEELLAIGLTLPGFVERSKVIASLPSLGLLTLAGMTPKDVEVEYVEVPDPASLTHLPGDFDAVAILQFLGTDQGGVQSRGSLSRSWSEGIHGRIARHRATG